MDRQDAGVAIEVASAVTPVMTVEQAVAHLEQLRQFRKRVLVQGVDYGVIAGIQRPTLLKPGAEKLANVFGLSVEHQLVEKIEDWQGNFFSYMVRAIVRSRRDGSIIADCVANCNSRETKYAYRNVFQWEATEEQKARAIRVDTRKKKKGSGDYKVYVVPNTEAASLVNTLLKMAQKRAMVGAVLIATRASEEYTQDVEDAAPAEAEDHDDATGEVLDPLGAAERDALFKELVTEGVTKQTFAAFYREATGRDFQRVFEQDVAPLRALAEKRRAAKGATAGTGDAAEPEPSKEPTV